MKRLTRFLFVSVCVAALAASQAVPSFADSVRVLSTPSAPGTCDVIPGNLVVNCGFETGDFTGWSLDGFTIMDFVSDTNPNSGLYSATEGEDHLGGFDQVIGTAPGKYSLSYWLYSDGQNRMRSRF